jgi:cysteine desulfurase
MPYFDHNATTPLSASARDAWLRANEEAWQNPSSPYREAARVKIRLDAARERLAEVLNAKPEQVVFNSGATEGVNAIMAYWAEVLPTEARIAINPTEHPCVIEAARNSFGERIDWLEVSPAGVVLPSAIERAVDSGSVRTVAVMAANNETGVLQPWREIAQVCRRRGVSYLCDASQWLGKLAASGLGGAGWMIGAAHKFGGPKGVGFMVIPPGAESFHSQRGGEQERGHRGGTENYPGIAGLVAALMEAEQKKVFLETERVQWRERFEAAVISAIPGARVMGAGEERLWNTVSLLLPWGENHRWVAKLDKQGFAVSTGSACASGRQGPSHVLAALGLPGTEAARVIRISSGWETTPEEWEALAKTLIALAAEFRVLSEASNVVRL